MVTYIPLLSQAVASKDHGWVRLYIHR